MTDQLLITGELVQLWWRRTRWVVGLLGLACVALFLLDPVPQDEAAKIVLAMGAVAICIGTLSSPSIDSTGHCEFLLTRAVSRTHILVTQLCCGLICVLGLTAIIASLHCAGLRGWVQGALLANEFFPHVLEFEGRALLSVLQVGLLGYWVGCAFPNLAVYVSHRLHTGATATAGCLLKSIALALWPFMVFSLPSPLNVVAAVVLVISLAASVWDDFRSCEGKAFLATSTRQGAKAIPQRMVYPSLVVGALLRLVRGVLPALLLGTMLLYAYWHVPWSMSHSFVTGKDPFSPRSPVDAACFVWPPIWWCFVVLGVGCGFWARRDARRRGHGFWAQVGSAAVCATVVGMAFYTELRRQGGIGRCRGCGQKALVWLDACPFCDDSFGGRSPGQLGRIPRRRILVISASIAIAALAIVPLLPISPEPILRRLAPWQPKFVVIDTFPMGLDVFVNGEHFGRSPVAIRVEELLERAPVWQSAPAARRVESPSEWGEHCIPIWYPKAVDGKPDRWAPFRRALGKRRLFAHFRYRDFPAVGRCNGSGVGWGLTSCKANFAFCVVLEALERRLRLLVASLSLADAPASDRWFDAAAELGGFGLEWLLAVESGPRAAGPPHLGGALDELVRRRFGITGKETPAEAEIAVRRILDAARTHGRYYDWKVRSCQRALELLGKGAAHGLRTRIVDQVASLLPHRTQHERTMLWHRGLEISSTLAMTSDGSAMPALVWNVRSSWWPEYEAIGLLKTDSAAHFLGKRLVRTGRIYPLSGLVATGRRSAIPYIREALRSRPGMSKAALIAALVRLGDEQASAEARPVLLDPSTKAWRADDLMLALARRGDDDSVDVLVQVLNDGKTDQVRRDAVKALASCEHLRALDALRRVLETGPGKLAGTVIWSLASQGREDAVDILTSVAAEGHGELTRKLGLAALGRPRSVPFSVLQALATSESTEVRKWLAEGLGQLATRQAMELLETMADDPDPTVKEKAREQLVLLREATELL